MNQHGFTIIELVIVLALIAIVISLGVGSGWFKPSYKCVDGYKYQVKHHSLHIVYDKDGKPVVCRK